MDLKKRLSSHPVNTLKKEISKTNVKGYSKMKKEAVIALMMKTPERFNHIKENVKVSKEEKTKARVTSILKKQEPATKGNFEKIKVKGKEYFIDTTTNKLYDIDSKKLVGSIVKGEVIMKDKKIIKKEPAAAPAAPTAAAAEPVKKKKIIKKAPVAAPAAAPAAAAEKSEIENWGKDINNVELEQNNKKLTNQIKDLINRKGDKFINIDGLFQADKKLANSLFMKYPAQKVLDGYTKFIEYLDDEGNQKIGQTDFNEFFSMKGGNIKTNFRGKDLSSQVLTKIQNEWKDGQKTLRKTRPRKS